MYVTAGYDVGARMFKLGGATPELVYESNKMVNHHGGVILVDGKLYGHSDKGGWTCQDFLTGEPVWQDKSLGKGCCTYVAGHLVCVSEGDGTVALVEASTAGWKEKGRFKLSPQTEKRKPQGRIWVHPVVVVSWRSFRSSPVVPSPASSPRAAGPATAAWPPALRAAPGPPTTGGVLWAGSEASPRWPGYFEGAIEAGELAAGDAAALLTA